MLVQEDTRRATLPLCISFLVSSVKCQKVNKDNLSRKTEEFYTSLDCCWGTSVLCKMKLSSTVLRVRGVILVPGPDTGDTFLTPLIKATWSLRSWGLGQIIPLVSVKCPKGMSHQKEWPPRSLPVLTFWLCIYLVRVLISLSTYASRVDKE